MIGNPVLLAIKQVAHPGTRAFLEQAPNLMHHHLERRVTIEFNADQQIAAEYIYRFRHRLYEATLAIGHDVVFDIWCGEQRLSRLW